MNLFCFFNFESFDCFVYFFNFFGFFCSLFPFILFFPLFYCAFIIFYSHLSFIYDDHLCILIIFLEFLFFHLLLFLFNVCLKKFQRNLFSSSFPFCSLHFSFCLAYCLTRLLVADLVADSLLWDISSTGRHKNAVPVALFLIYFFSLCNNKKKTFVFENFFLHFNIDQQIQQQQQSFRFKKLCFYLPFSFFFCLHQQAKKKKKNQKNCSTSFSVSNFLLTKIDFALTAHFFTLRPLHPSVRVYLRFLQIQISSFSLTINSSKFLFHKKIQINNKKSFHSATYITILFWRRTRSFV